MNFYFSIKAFLIFIASSYAPSLVDTVSNADSQTVKYEIFNKDTHQEFKYSDEVIYKKAPTPWVKVFNK